MELQSREDNLAKKKLEPEIVLEGLIRSEADTQVWLILEEEGKFMNKK